MEKELDLAPNSMIDVLYTNLDKMNESQHKTCNLDLFLVSGQ